MPVRRVFIPEIGEVTLAKRRGAKNIRLSVTGRGEVRVSMPNWTPYSAGIAFARSRREWIAKHRERYQDATLVEGMAIGKAHRLHFIASSGPRTTTRVNTDVVIITSPLPFTNPTVQAKAIAAAERALRQEATNLLPQRLAILAIQHGFEYKAVNVRKLTSRWGSCSHDKTITLSYFLIQLPWDLIDYVLIHELVHTQHLNHGVDFWQAFEHAMPSARHRRKLIHKHSPRLETT